jgi:chromosome segregation ATPase
MTENTAIQKLQAKRSSLSEQIRKIDARIAALQRAEKDAQDRALLALIRSQNLTPERLRAMLESPQKPTAQAAGSIPTAQE